MKRLVTILSIITFLSSCEENFLIDGCFTPRRPCLEVSLVSEICGQAVLKIEDSNYYYLGEQWGEYEHVFFTRLHCDDLGLGAIEGTFFVKILSDYDEQNCATCLANFAYPGEKEYPVKVMDECPEI